MSCASVPSSQVALIFDLDGVIVDSMPLHTEAWEIYLARHGVEAQSVPERMHGRRNDEIVRDFFGPGLSAEDAFRHGAAKEALYRELMAPRLEEFLIPGVRQFLEDHSRTPLGVASNAEPQNVSFVLEGAGLTPLFKAIIDGHQVERPKPFPDVFLKAAAALGVPPQRCIIFEDSPAGIEAARAAGARVVAVTTAGTELPRTDYSIRDFEDAGIRAWVCSARAAT